MKIHEDSFYIESACPSEVLHLSDMYDYEENNKKPFFLGICLAFYSYAHNNFEFGFKTRLKHIWHIIKNGHPYKDDLIFDIKSAKILRNSLDELIKKAETVSK